MFEFQSVTENLPEVPTEEPEEPKELGMTVLRPFNNII